jgi:acyl-CoA synthetase (AMP-forming)/AMP-acid ligase II
VPKTHITDYLFEHANQLPNKLALSVYGQEFSWKELADKVEQTAAVLSRRLRDSQGQQIVALMFPNSWQYVVTYLAILDLGHIAMPVDVIYKSLEIDAILKQIPPDLIVTDRDSKPRMDTDRPVVVFEDLKPVEAVPKKLRLPAEKQIASLIFTSGTTGKPKAVPYTHANHIWNIKVCSEVWNWTNQDSLLISVRLSHFNGIVMGLAGALYHGNAFYLLDRFNAEETLELLASGKATLFTHSPLVYSKLLEVEKTYDLSKVRLFISGSGPLAPSVWQDFKNRFGQEILEVYGSSETGRIASNLLNERIPGSPGRPLPGVEMKFNSHDEVLVKSPGVFPGYFQNDEATDEGFRDGFWRTGDIGEIKNGRVILKGRTHERIRKQGYTISPRDVEWALMQNPQIKECHVMGVAQPGDPNDKIAYFIVGDLSEAEIIDFSKQNLPSIWRADKIIFLDALPRNPNGKPKLQMLKVMV